jgi:hypothetical protein
MDALRRLACICLVAFAGCATTEPSDYVYFPGLAKGVLAGDASAFEQVLAKSNVTPPGEQLEELAELSSRFVRIQPREFLRVQSSASTCFGVAFMGPEYVDDPVARTREQDLRRKALESVFDPALASIKLRCLGELAGS